MEEEKIVYKLKKQPLASEKKELRAKRVRRILTVALCVSFLALGVFIGLTASSLGHDDVSKGGQIDAKWQEITNYMNGYWLYGNDYADLEQTLHDNAFYGMTSFADDPYTSYMSNEDYTNFANSINMSIVGIGISYVQFDDMSTIVRVIKDSPAEIAGLQAGDLIQRIDGVDVAGKTTDEIQDLALGDEGSVVKVEVVRDGKQLTFDIVRSPINATVYAYVEADHVVLDIDSFGESTYNECINYLDEYQDYEKIIIDLRDNTGGYQTSVQQVANLFLGEDVLVMLQEFKSGLVEKYNTIGSVYYPNFKELVVLVNENTASAAEVLAIALKQQHTNTTLVGTTTFGKGVVQSSFVLSDGSVLKVTSSKWLAPNGEWINGVGVTPDIEVFLDEILYEKYTLMQEDEQYDLDSVSYYAKIAADGLKFLGYDVKRHDGYFDTSLKAALKAFQSDKGFEANGILDAQTYETIVSNVIKEWAMNPAKDLQMLAAVECIND